MITENNIEAVGHTPGPWSINEISNTTIWGGGKCLAATYGETNEEGDGWTPESIPWQEANARLIAAAPQLLEVLEEVSQMVVATTYPDGSCIESWLMDEVKAAISAAKEGGAS